MNNLVVLKTKNKKKDVVIESKYIDFSPYGELPTNYKQFYGIRFSGINQDGISSFYGFDLFYQVSGCGLDLENFLSFCNEHKFNIDWYNFQRTSYRNGWSYDVLIRKVSHSIIDVFGIDYWNQLNEKFIIYQRSINNLRNNI